MYQINILIVEDEEKLRKLIKKYLFLEGFHVHEASNGIEALKIFDTETIDLVVMDVMMPFKNGYEVSKEIRKTSQVPIIMLTARSAEDDKLQGFDVGIDDYVTKPFSTRELMARIKALLKRTNVTSTNEKMQFGVLSIDTGARRILVDGEDMTFSPKEYDCLMYFVDNANQALSREQILNRVWGFDYFGDDRTVDTVIKRLRKKMGIEGDRIQTVRGVGYRFEV
ncbi:MAG: DNA-binding response regulator [Firmicutes bacterium HGW-Firmicutes-2]|jgi:DNA-binding response OmpR family regulator|nr:MAG: DNA-binding response regulator [Firmicutes bacterium HGW-Firmicutes-2]